MTSNRADSVGCGRDRERERRSIRAGAGRVKAAVTPSTHPDALRGRLNSQPSSACMDAACETAVCCAPDCMPLLSFPRHMPAPPRATHPPNNPCTLNLQFSTLNCIPYLRLWGCP
jgi:hypothetical protein